MMRIDSLGLNDRWVLQVVRTYEGTVSGSKGFDSTVRWSTRACSQTQQRGKPAARRAAAGSSEGDSLAAILYLSPSMSAT